MEIATLTGLTWRDVCEDPNLRDLPYKIELNEYGQIVMSPTRVYHGAYQSEVASLLKAFLGDQGRVITECAVQTTKGTKVADAAWASWNRWELIQDEFDASVAPEICVKVLSPGNTVAEMDDKRKLYLAAGAEEFWLCDRTGKLFFFDASGSLPQSSRVPEFPQDLDF